MYPDGANLMISHRQGAASKASSISFGSRPISQHRRTNFSGEARVAASKRARSRAVGGISLSVTPSEATSVYLCPHPSAEGRGTMTAPWGHALSAGTDRLVPLTFQAARAPQTTWSGLRSSSCAPSPSAAGADLPGQGHSSRRPERVGSARCRLTTASRGYALRDSMVSGRMGSGGVSE